MKLDLLAHLDAGSTGCLLARVPHGGTVAVYLMLGEILAAHGSDDRERLLRLIHNTGAVEDSRIDLLRRSFEGGRSITEELFEVLPEDSLQDLLAERFRENLFQYLQAPAPAKFEAMESVFVENIQVGHDSRALVEELAVAVTATARLREPPGLTLAPGAGTMKDPAHLKLASLTHPRLPLLDLIVRSPYESGRTLVMISEMLERGSLVVVASRSEGEITDRPRPKADPAAKVVVAPGKSPPARASEGQRDAVAAALANAVSAAVAKVGRQKSDPATAPTLPPKPPPARAEEGSEGGRERVEMPARPVVEPVSSPMARNRPPASVSAGAAAPAPPAVRSPPMRPVPAEAPPVKGPDRAATPAAGPAPKAAPASPAPPPPGPAAKKAVPEIDVEDPTEEVDDEMAAFQDYDYERVGGEFVSSNELLDRVELVSNTRDVLPAPAVAAPVAPDPGTSVLIEMEDAENATRAELAGAVALNFAGPKLAEEETRRKVDVVNEILEKLAAALDAASGAGMGQARVQLLIEGTPGAFATLFKGVEVEGSGRLPADGVLKNLRKRPASEHRRLLNRALADLIERSLSLASEELPEEGLDQLLEGIAGYQQRLGM